MPNPPREQAGPLDDWAVDELLDATRTLVLLLSDGAAQRLRRPLRPMQTCHVDAATMRRILDVIEPPSRTRKRPHVTTSSHLVPTSSPETGRRHGLTSSPRPPPYGDEVNLTRHAKFPDVSKNTPFGTTSSRP